MKTASGQWPTSARPTAASALCTSEHVGSKRMPPSSASARLICKHGVLEIAGERDGSAEQGDRITFEISAAPAC
jgi:hypothetical protein